MKQSCLRLTVTESGDGCLGYVIPAFLPLYKSPALSEMRVLHFMEKRTKGPRRLCNLSETTHPARDRVGT